MGMMNHMDIKCSIQRSIRRCIDGILLSSDVTAFGSRSEFSAALRDLSAVGAIERLEQDVYPLPTKLEELGAAIILVRAHQRQAKVRLQTPNVLADQTTPRSDYVSFLAKQKGVTYKPTFYDHWANAVTRLAGDEVTSDATDDLRVALTRADAIS